MLVSVTERTKGDRHPQGHRGARRVILTQFLVEAIIMAGLGGLIGVLLGVGASIGGRSVLPKFVPAFPVPVLTFAPVLIAFGVSLGIGLLAGGYPAHRAARLRPIEALRFE